MLSHGKNRGSIPLGSAKLFSGLALLMAGLFVSAVKFVGNTGPSAYICGRKRLCEIGGPGSHDALVVRLYGASPSGMQLARFYSLMIERDLFGAITVVRSRGRIGTACPAGVT